MCLPSSASVLILTALAVLREQEQEQEVGGAHVAVDIDVFGAGHRREQFGGFLFVRFKPVFAGKGFQRCMSRTKTGMENY